MTYKGVLIPRLTKQDYLKCGMNDVYELLIRPLEERK
jgi:hypothetical protein